MSLTQVVRRLAASLWKSERLINESMIEVATLYAVALEARQVAKLAPTAHQEVQTELLAAQAALMEAQTRVASAHEKLAAAKEAVGDQTVLLGPVTKENSAGQQTVMLKQVA